MEFEIGRYYCISCELILVLERKDYDSEGVSVSRGAMPLACTTGLVLPQRFPREAQR